MNTERRDAISSIENEFRSERWNGLIRPYTGEDVYRLRGSIDIEHTWAKKASKKLWEMLQSQEYIPTLGVLTGNQAVEMVLAGLRAIYVSGWQVAADANLSGKTYPDQSLYPSNSVPELVRRVSQALQRADQIDHSEGRSNVDWLAPVVADGEAGFGGPLNVFELTKAMIEVGAAGVHYEDQLSSEKKCGHLGGKVLVPTQQFIRSLVAARFAADIMGVPTLIIARTDASTANLITSDIDEQDGRFLTGERTSEGFYRMIGGSDAAIARGIAYAPYADLVWCETSSPDLREAEDFASAIHKEYPGKLLAYNCSSSFNWEQHLDEEVVRTFQKELGRMGYKFQFVTLAGFHSVNHSMFELARAYAREGMSAYVQLQRNEFISEKVGYRAIKHQKFVGTAYFDDVADVISEGATSTTAMKQSTETAQFAEKAQITQSLEEK